MLCWTTRLLAAAVGLATLLPLARRDAWWIRVFDFPRLQVLVAALVLIGVAPFSEPSIRGLAAVETVLSAVAVAQGARVLPFTRLWPRRRRRAAAGDRGAALGVLVANVLMTNRRADAFLQMVRDLAPDLILVLEADDWWRRSLAPLEAAYPHRVERPQSDTYGMLLLSRLEIERPEVRFLVRDDVPSIRCRVVLPAGRRVAFHGLHPRPPGPGEASRTTRRDAELLLVGREIRPAAGPVIVAGDLNDVSWSHTTRLFCRLAGLLDPRLGRGPLGTFPAYRPALRFPIDHVLHSPALELVELRRGPAGGSDHLPLYARLRPVGDAGEAAAPRAEADDQVEARRKIVAGLAADD